MSPTSTASSIVMQAGCLSSSSVGRSRSNVSMSSVLKSGIPATARLRLPVEPPRDSWSRAQLASLAHHWHQQQAPPCSYSFPNPSPFPRVIVTTHVTQDRTRHPGFPAVQLRLTCDQICTGSESLHVKYGAKEKKEKWK